MASADGRTCSTIAFRFMALARSRMAIASACCCGAFRFCRLGQSMLATVETQAARNSRGAAGGSLPLAWIVPFGAVATFIGVEQLANKPLRASMPAIPPSANARFFISATTAPYLS